MKLPPMKQNLATREEICPVLGHCWDAACCQSSFLLGSLVGLDHEFVLGLVLMQPVLVARESHRNQLEGKSTKGLSKAQEL